MAGQNDQNKNTLDPGDVAKLLATIQQLSNDVKALKENPPAGGNADLLKAVTEYRAEIDKLKQLQEDFKEDAAAMRANASPVRVISYEETIKAKEAEAAKLVAMIPPHIHGLANSLMKKVGMKMKDQNWDEVTTALVNSFHLGKNKKTEADLTESLSDLKALIQAPGPQYRIQKSTWGDIESAMKKSFTAGTQDQSVFIEA